MSEFETCMEIENAIAYYFGPNYTVVPNVNGMFPYEMDLLVLANKSLYANEVEIKISKSDLKRDGQKFHNHEGFSWSDGCYTRCLWFAMPEKMADCVELVPINAGILLVDKKGRTRSLRNPKVNKLAKKWTFEQAFHVARLGVFRYWNIRRNWRSTKEQEQAQP